MPKSLKVKHEPSKVVKKDDVVLLHIFLIDESFREMTVSQSLTAKDILFAFSEEIECTVPQYFSLARPFKTKNGEQADVWIDLNLTCAELKNEFLDEDSTAPLNLLFKVKYFKPPRWHLDTRSLDLFYKQIKIGILSSQYFVPENIVVYLAAYELQIKYGDFKADRKSGSSFS